MDKKKNNTEKKPTNGSAVTLRDLFTDGLKDIYYAENALVKALPDMYEKATDQKLKTAIKDHIAQTEQQVLRLEQAFESMGMKAEGKKCKAIEGILEEGSEAVGNAPAGPVRDAAIIGSSQKVEHYEIASYGTLAAYAKVLNERLALDLLLRTLGEEKKADCLLSIIADTNLNSQAAAGKHKSKDINAV
ncbi:ferritin-like domain-containing protein [Chryseobacterium sp.]|uniref:YciE/YciF ferroxidase family protein n=1 Tax=Chryseobacterium sp. TaxID=1871047 RepID=UPI0011CA5308|nr:ferritin-like domain-containing protein [Chryseobacterium sp.]TXF79008.1 ferritin-like domain-containing protein [Chryseobacterium sp.]